MERELSEDAYRRKFRNPAEVRAYWRFIKNKKKKKNNRVKAAIAKAFNKVNSEGS